MDKFIKLAVAALAIGILAVACEEIEDAPSSHFEDKASQQSSGSPSRVLLTPDNYNSEVARGKGYTVIHQDTSTSIDDERCGYGGARYSRNGLSMCDIFSNSRDWHTASDAAVTQCPGGFVRVDQAGIGRGHLAGSTRQCRTTQKITTTDEVAHYYCPHGPTLVGIRSGTAAGRLGVCRLKCDPDTRQFFSSECGGSSSSSSPFTTSTTAPPPIPNSPRYIPSPIPRFPAPVAPPPPSAAPDFGDFNPGPLSISSAPDQTGIHIVGIETWFWISSDQWSATTETRVHGEETYELTATPSNLRILITGPARKPSTKTIDCGNMPVIQPNTGVASCVHKWTNAGEYEITSEVEWSTSWICSPDCGDGTLPLRTSRRGGYVINVTEAQAIVIS